MTPDANGLDAVVAQAAEALEQATALLITAGAGMGVDSGLPDFRGTGGFWQAYPAVAKLGLRFEELANPEWFQRSPELAWAFYGHRLNLYRRTNPHDGFRQLLEWGAAKAHGYFVFTSNVDGHFQKAGFDPARIVECHGSILHFQCASPCGDDIWDAGSENVTVDEEIFRARAPLPKCRHCGALARPNVLMFGDDSWNPARTRQQDAALAKWLEDLRYDSARLVIVELGAGRAFPTVRFTSENLAFETGATLIRINPREAEVSTEHFSLPLGALEGLRRLAAHQSD
jgi:NAD-dependent SIR2 family protein deacetylase